MKRNILAIAALCSAISMAACSAPATGLEFTGEGYTPVTLDYNGRQLSFRYYPNIFYVTNVADSTYQKMNLYIPEEYFNGGSVNGYTANTAPIFLYHKIAGYTAARATTLASAAVDRSRGPQGGRPGGGPQGGPQGGPGMGQGGPRGPQGGRGPEENIDETIIPRTVTDSPNHPFMPLAALLRGYVVAAPGARGRNSDGGQAPAALIDLKAAVRYLRFNDAAMPGDAGRIISDGTSAGGALSSLLGSTGNYPAYEPYLEELGAAKASDDIFATQAYCPITNLEHADMAYEWMFGSLSEGQHGEITPEMKEISSSLASAFPAYVNSLGYKNARGESLSLDENGQGSFVGWVCHFLRESAQEQIDKGVDLGEYKWVEVKDGKVGEIDWEGYVQFVGRKKTPVAFDALDLSSAENNEFGERGILARHFTAFGMEHNTAEDSRMAPSELVFVMNPMNFIGNDEATTSPHWRICHGTKDSDTAVAIPILLATNLLNHGYDVIFRSTWDQPHGGDYDTTDQFDWIDSICK